MSTIPASGVEATTDAQLKPAAVKQPAPGTAPVSTSAAPGHEPSEEEEGQLEEPALLGRFVLFNAVPSSIISGVVHFVGFLILALLTIPPPPKTEALSISTPPAEQVEKVEELHEEKLLLNSTVSDERTEMVQQVLQNAVAATETPSVAMDVDA